MVKVTFLLVKEYLMMLTCHVQIVSLRRGFIPLDLCIQLYIMILQQAKKQGQVPSSSVPQYAGKKRSAFINTTLVLTG